MKPKSGVSVKSVMDQQGQVRSLCGQKKTKKQVQVMENHESWAVKVSNIFVGLVATSGYAIQRSGQGIVAPCEVRLEMNIDQHEGGVGVNIASEVR